MLRVLGSWAPQGPRLHDTATRAASSSSFPSASNPLTSFSSPDVANSAEWVTLQSPPALSAKVLKGANSAAVPIDAGIDEELAVVDEGRVLVWSAGGALRRTFDISHTNVARGVAAGQRALGWRISDVDFGVVGSWDKDSNSGVSAFSEHALITPSRYLSIVVSHQDQPDLEMSASLSMLLDDASGSVQGGTAGSSLLFRENDFLQRKQSNSAYNLGAHEHQESSMGETALAPRLLVFDVVSGDDHEVALPAGTRRVNSVRLGPFALRNEQDTFSDQWALIVQPDFQRMRPGMGLQRMFHPLDSCVPVETLDDSTNETGPISENHELIFAHSPRRMREQSWIVTYDHAMHSHAIWLGTHAPPPAPRNYLEAAKLSRSTASGVSDVVRPTPHLFTPGHRHGTGFVNTTTYFERTPRIPSGGVFSAPRSANVAHRARRTADCNIFSRRLVLCPVSIVNEVQDRVLEAIDPCGVFLAHDINDEALLAFFDKASHKITMLCSDGARRMKVVGTISGVVSCAPICSTRPASKSFFDILVLTSAGCFLHVGPTRLCAIQVPSFAQLAQLRFAHATSDRVTLLATSAEAYRVEVVVKPRNSLVTDCFRALLCTYTPQLGPSISVSDGLRLVGQFCETTVELDESVEGEWERFCMFITDAVGLRRNPISSTVKSNSEGPFERLLNTSMHQKFGGETTCQRSLEVLQSGGAVRLNAVAVVDTLHVLLESYLIQPLMYLSATALSTLLLQICGSDPRLAPRARFYAREALRRTDPTLLPAESSSFDNTDADTLQRFVFTHYLSGTSNFGRRQRRVAIAGPVPYAAWLHRVVLKCFHAYFDRERGLKDRLYEAASERTAFFCLSCDDVADSIRRTTAYNIAAPSARVAAILYDEAVEESDLDSLTMCLGLLLRECYHVSRAPLTAQLSDAHLGSAEPQISALLFDSKDDRLAEAVRLLRADQPTDLHACSQSPGQDDHAHAQAQQRHLFSVAMSRKLSLGVGRGMMDCGCVWTLLNKDGGEQGSNAVSYTMLELDIPTINLNGRTLQAVATSSGSATEGNSPSIARELIVALADARESPFPCGSMISTQWPRFHNGIASGMRLLNSLDRAAREGAVEWLLFNRTLASQRSQREAKNVAQASVHGNAQAQMQAQMLLAHRSDVVSELEHAGVLYAMGLCGLLKDFPLTRVFSYLAQAHEATSIGMLLGLSASHRGTHSQNIARVLSVHTPLISAASQLDLPVNVQSAALFGLGLLHEGTQHRRTVITLMNGIVSASAASNQRPTTVSIAGASSSSAAAFASQTAAGTIGSNNSFVLLQGGTSGRRSLSLSCGLALGLVLQTSQSLSAEKQSLRVADLDVGATLIALMRGVSADFPSSASYSGASMVEASTSAQESLLVMNSTDEQALCSQKLPPGTFLDVDVVVPSAIACLGIAYCRLQTASIVQELRFPQTLQEFSRSPSLSRPPFVMLRAMSLLLVDWNATDSFVQAFDAEWLDSLFPSFLRSERMSDEALNLPDQDMPDFLRACRDYAETGFLLALAFHFAGTQNSRVRDLIVHSLDRFSELAERARPTVKKMVGTRKRNVPDSISEEFLLNYQTVQDPPVCHRWDHCAAVLATAAACVFAGSGDLALFGRFRRLSLRVFIKDTKAHQPTTTFGYHQALSTAIGLLFLGRGQLTFNNDPRSVAFLVVSLFPLWPAHTADNSGYLQALRHFYCLATTNRTLAIYDSDTRRPIPCPVIVELHPDSRGNVASPIELMSPCILPARTLVKTIAVASDRYTAPVWANVLDTESPVANQRISLVAKLSAGSLSYIVDPTGKKSITQRPWPRAWHTHGNSSGGTCNSLSPFFDVVYDYIRTQPELAWFAAYFCGNFRTKEADEANHTERLDFCSQALYQCLVQDKQSVLGILLELHEVIRRLRSWSTGASLPTCDPHTRALVRDAAVLVALYQHPHVKSIARLLNESIIEELHCLMSEFFSPCIQPLLSGAPSTSDTDVKLELAAVYFFYPAVDFKCWQVRQAVARLPEALQGALFTDICLDPETVAQHY